MTWGSPAMCAYVSVHLIRDGTSLIHWAEATLPQTPKVCHGLGDSVDRSSF